MKAPTVDVRSARRIVLVALDFAMPVALYYVLRALGTSVYTALLVGAALSLVSAGFSMLRERRTNGVALFMAVLLLLSTVVALVGGGPRFLLARDAFVTGVAGLWFLGSCWAPRPLAYHFARAVGEGRFGWPPDWEALWASAPRFRRMWRVASVMWGVGTLLDAVLRWVLAYTLPLDVVPVVTLALYAVTTVVLFVVTNVYYVLSGALDPHSEMYAAPNAAATPLVTRGSRC